MYLVQHFLWLAELCHSRYTGLCCPLKLCLWSTGEICASRAVTSLTQRVKYTPTALSCFWCVWKWISSSCFTNRRKWIGYIGLNLKMIHTGGHSEGRTFNLVGEVELIPLLPVYTRSSNASLFSLAPRSSISSIYLLPPHTLTAESTPTHSIYVACVRLYVCVCVSMCIQPQSFVHGGWHVRLSSESLSLWVQQG